MPPPQRPASATEGVGREPQLRHWDRICSGHRVWWLRARAASSRPIGALSKCPHLRGGPLPQSCIARLLCSWARLNHRSTIRVKHDSRGPRFSCPKSTSSPLARLPRYARYFIHEHSACYTWLDPRRSKPRSSPCACTPAIRLEHEGGGSRMRDPAGILARMGAKGPRPTGLPRDDGEDCRPYGC